MNNSDYQVITGKEGGGTYREGLCMYMDLLYRENSEDGDDGIERGIIVVGNTIFHVIHKYIFIHTYLYMFV
jgi:hypothetical protein